MNRLLTLCLAVSPMLATPSAADADNAEPVRLAVVGLSHDHVFWLLHRDRSLGDVRIVGVYETNAALAERRLRDAGLGSTPVYEDLDRLLAETRPEAACLFGSIREHREQAIACARAGVHVMVEKPLALTYDDALAMADAATARGVHLITNYETTWYGSVQAMRRRLAGDASLGPIRRMTFRMGHPGPIEIGCRDVFVDWLLDPEENGGGAIMDFGCYGANIATWLMGDERPVAVSAITRRLKPDLYARVDDDATITIEYPFATAVVQASWNWPRNVKESRVYTERADLLAADGTTLFTRIGDTDAITQAGLAPRSPEQADPFAHLVAVVRGRSEPNALSSIENNLVVTRLLDAARESAATGRRVELDWPARD